MGGFGKWLGAYAIATAAIYAIILLFGATLAFLIWKPLHPNWLALLRVSALTGLILSSVWMIGESDE